MPSTLLGVASFVFLLLPGYVYEVRRARDVPERARSPFRETLAILFVGVAVDGVAVLLLVIASLTLSPLTPDLHVLIRDLRGYATDHYGLLAWWAAALLLVASGVAYLVAVRPWRTLVLRHSRGYARLLRVADPQHSAWWHLFHEHPRNDKYVGCHLDDGSYVAGILHSYSRVADETGDRDLTLRATTEHPLVCRPNGAQQATPLLDVAAVVISARKIALLTVTYLAAAPAVGAGEVAAHRREPVA